MPMDARFISETTGTGTAQTRDTMRRTHPMIAGIAFALLGAMSPALPSAASAAEVCTTLETLVGEARSNFARRSDSRDGEAPGLADAEECNLALVPGGRRVFQCRWGFAYRSQASATKFAEVDDALTTCAQGMRTRDDQAVNHPDTYELRRYRAGAIDLSVSLKDKAALRKTFVFLSIHGDPS